MSNAGVVESHRAENLHTLARRYCIENIEHWADVYAAMPERRISEDYSDDAYRTFPRYIVLGAILARVETLEPLKLPNVEALRTQLVGAALAEDAMTKPPHNPIQRDSMDDERRKFTEFISSLQSEDLDYVQELFYRRKLSDDEVRNIGSLLKDRWAADLGCWYPLDEKPPGIDVEAFHTAVFERAVGSKWLNQRLSNRGVNRVLEIQEGGEIGYERDLDAPPADAGPELWRTDREASFVIYTSHESSISLGGWILDEVRSAWPSWADHIYTGWDQA